MRVPTSEFLFMIIKITDNSAGSPPDKTVLFPLELCKFSQRASETLETPEWYVRDYVAEQSSTTVPRAAQTEQQRTASSASLNLPSKHSNNSLD